jgi:hypothetical protein
MTYLAGVLTLRVGRRETPVQCVDDRAALVFDEAMIGWFGNSALRS